MWAWARASARSTSRTRIASIEQKVPEPPSRHVLLPDQPHGILDFVSNPVFLGKTLFPCQGTVLKVLGLERDNLTAYDASYVALAEALDAPLLTFDEKLANAPGHRAAIEGVRVEG